MSIITISWLRKWGLIKKHSITPLQKKTMTDRLSQKKYVFLTEPSLGVFWRWAGTSEASQLYFIFRNSATHVISSEENYIISRWLCLCLLNFDCGFTEGEIKKKTKPNIKKGLPICVSSVP